MPQCGLAPGFIGIVAHHLAQGFDTLHEVKMRVGALPAFPTNCAEIQPDLERGRPDQRVLPPLRGHPRRPGPSRRCRWKGWSTSRWTAPSTRPSTPPAAWARCARRWPAACRRSTTRACATPATAPDEDAAGRAAAQARPGDAEGHHARAIPSTMQDVVLVFVTVSGCAAACCCRRSSRARSSPSAAMAGARCRRSRSPPPPASARPSTCSAKGKLPQRGFIRQEQVPLPAFLANRFGSRLPAVAPGREHRLTVQG
jgi:hypothetical protein